MKKTLFLLTALLIAKQALAMEDEENKKYKTCIGKYIKKETRVEIPTYTRNVTGTCKLYYLDENGQQVKTTIEKKSSEEFNISSKTKKSHKFLCLPLKITYNKQVKTPAKIENAIIKYYRKPRPKYLLPLRNKFIDIVIITE